MINKYKYSVVIILSSLWLMMPVMADEYTLQLNQKLTKNYDLAIQSLAMDKNAQALLKNTQEQWISLIEAQCKTEAIVEAALFQGCVNREIKERIQHIQKLIDYQQAIERKKQLQKNIDQYEYQEELFTELETHNFMLERFQNIENDSTYVFLTVLTKDDQPIQTIFYRPPFVTMQPSGAGKISSNEEQFLDRYKLTLIDLNNDGYDDLILFNGRSGSYGLTYYNIYLYDPKTQQFIENKALNEIFTGVNQKTDPKDKTIIRLSKSGATIHTDERYQVIENVPVFYSSVYEDEAKIIETQPCGIGKWCKKERKTRE